MGVFVCICMCKRRSIKVKGQLLLTAYTLPVLTSKNLTLFPERMTHRPIFIYIFKCYFNEVGTAVAQWLRCCATNWKVADSIPDGVIVIFH